MHVSHTGYVLCYSHVYPLLSLLKADCSPQDLQDAVKEAMDRAEAIERQNRDLDLGGAAAPAEGEDNKLAEEFVKEMVESGFTRSLALKALAARVPAEDKAKGEM
jgi:hypothetical protein